MIATQDVNPTAAGTSGTPSPEPSGPPARTLVWDLPLRLFHWLLAASFTGAFLTAESERWRDVHALLGYTALVLVAFRLVWGVVGTRYARFPALPFAPRRAFDYLRALLAGRPQHHVGHNPAGSLAIWLLLAGIVAAAASGLATYNDFGGEWLEDLHEGIANGMLALVAIHVAGVLVGSFAHRENLVRAMLDGRKRVPRSEGIRRARPLVAVLLLGLVVGLWTGALPSPGLEQTNLTSVTSAERASRHAHDDDD